MIFSSRANPKLLHLIHRPGALLVDDREAEGAGSGWDEVGDAEVAGHRAFIVLGQAAVGWVGVFALAQWLLDAERLTRRSNSTLC